MLYVTEFDIQDRLGSGKNFTFGDVFQHTVVLPAKVRKLKSFCCFAELDSCTKMAHLEYTENDGDTTAKEILSTQVGSISLCLNKTNVIVSNSPLHSILDLHDTSFNGNKVEFDTPVEVTAGSTLQITIEEKEQTPFTTSSLYYSYNQPRRNNYTVKIYLEYDK